MTQYDTFDSYRLALRDYNLYLKAKGYQQEADRTYWEPRDIADIEPERNFGPGAMVRGELEDYQNDDCEEF